MNQTLEYDLLYSQMGYLANEHIIFSIWLRFVCVTPKGDHKFNSQKLHFTSKIHCA